MERRGYQERAFKESVAALTGGGGFLLTLEMRTGKTPVSLRVASHFMIEEQERNGRTLTLLIVCPPVAVPVWKAHIKKMGVPDDTLILTYNELCASHKAWYRWGRKNRGFFMILDEAHFIKTRGSDRSRVVRTLAKRSKYRLALTGTPISQGIQDAWAIYDYLGQVFGPWDDQWEGGLDGHIVPGFETTYLIYGGFRNHEIVGYRNEDQFNKIFNEHSFRTTLREAKQEGGKGSMVLRYQKRHFDLDAISQGVYDTLQEELEVIVNAKKIRVPNVLSCVAKLQQICGGFIIEQIFTGRYSKRGKPKYKKEIHQIPGEGKLQLLLKEVESLPRGKFIVICRFIHELEAAQQALQAEGYSVAIVRGGMPYDGEFATDVICMQIQSGMAVDMSKADTVIFYSLDYSYINFEQSRFRILNYDKNRGNYIFLLAKGTVDEIVYAAIKTKKRVADLVVDRYRIRRKRHARLKQADRRLEGETEGKTRRSIPISFARIRG